MVVLEYFIAVVFAVDVVLGFRKAYLDDKYNMVIDPK